MKPCIYEDLEQGSDEWLAARCGIVTASVVGQLITVKQPTGIVTGCVECGAMPGELCVSLSRKDRPAIKTLHPGRVAPDDAPPILEVADNDTARALTRSLLAEKITGRVEDGFMSRDMERGVMAEPYARDVYAEHYAEVEEVGLMVREDYGTRVGYSPDGLVGTDGLIEIKSPRAKTHLNTLLTNTVPAEYMAQLQAGLWVSGRAWIDFISYHGGLPLYVERVTPNPDWQEVIKAAAVRFQEQAEQMLDAYHTAVQGRPQTEYIDLFEEEGIVI